MMSRSLAVHAVVVTWRPDFAQLEQLLRATRNQADRIHIIDNGNGIEPGWDFLPMPTGDSVHHLGTNTGLGHAQNVGIGFAVAAGATHVLLLDQDSLPEPDMVASLLAALESPQARARHVAAVGPLVMDRDEVSGFVSASWLGYRARLPVPGETLVPCDMLFASGMLLPAWSLDAVGSMDEGLFIDKIDTDWCLRAQALGLSVAGVAAARMRHQIGQARDLAGWPCLSRSVVLHSPWRYYTQVRNSLWLCRRAHASWRWRFSDLKQTMALALWLGVTSPERRRYAPWIWRGLKDGVGPQSALPELPFNAEA